MAFCPAENQSVQMEKYYLTTRTLNREAVRNTSVKFKEMVVRKNLLKLLLSILSVTLWKNTSTIFITAGSTGKEVRAMSIQWTSKEMKNKPDVEQFLSKLTGFEHAQRHKLEHHKFDKDFVNARSAWKSYLHSVKIFRYIHLPSHCLNLINRMDFFLYIFFSDSGIINTIPTIYYINPIYSGLWVVCQFCRKAIALFYVLHDSTK